MTWSLASDQSGSRRTGRYHRSLIAAAAVLVLTVVGPLSAKGYRQGELVLFEGLVTDASGTPIPNVRVVLEASRRSLTLRKMRRESEGLVRRSTLTDDVGAYEFRWPWHGYYNSFYVLVVDSAGGLKRDADLRIVEALEVTRTLQDGLSEPTSLIVSDSAFVLRHREFIASIQSPDQQRIYEEMGKPDRVETARRADGEEISWWYFASGQAFRFLDGAFTGTDDFDPVEPF